MSKTLLRTIDFAASLRALVLSLLVAASAMLALSSPAAAWWNDDWSLRKKITIDTSASGANITDPIGTQAVLVRLHAGNFRFAQAKEDGSDLRFIAGDDKTPLKFHVEGYDSLLANAFVWVQVPDLKPGAKTDIWLYYGNKKAVARLTPKARMMRRRSSSIISTSVARRHRIPPSGPTAPRAPVSRRTARSSARVSSSMAALP